MATISASPSVTTDVLTGTRQRQRAPLSTPGDWSDWSDWLRRGAQAPADASRPRPSLKDGLQDTSVRMLLLVVAVFVTALAVSAFAGHPATGTGTPTSMPAGPVETAAYPAYTVTTGDTLWSIAEQVSPEVDPRAVVLQLRVLNNMAPQDSLQVGDVLLLPSN